MLRKGSDKTFTGYSRETVVAKFFQSYFDDSGFRRWKSTNNIPFEDMLTDWMDLGLMTQREVTASGDARRQEEKAVIAEYFKRQAAGDNVVNITNGERF